MDAPPSALVYLMNLECVKTLTASQSTIIILNRFMMRPKQM